MKYLLFFFLSICLTPFLLAEVPPIHEVKSALELSAQACLDTLAEEGKNGDLRVLGAAKDGNRIAAIVAITSAGPFGVFEFNDKNPNNCKLWYRPSDEVNDIRSSMKSGGFGGDGYLLDPKIRIVGWWNSGTQEYLVLERHHGDMSQSWYHLLFVREGKLVQSIPNANEYANEEQPWMDFSSTYYCEPDLSKTGIVTLNCKNHQKPNVPPPFKTKNYCWNKTSLVECK